MAMKTPDPFAFSADNEIKVALMVGCPPSGFLTALITQCIEVARAVLFVHAA